jgi:hypothetical protein
MLPGTGVTYTHRDTKCTFEVLIDDYLDGDPALTRLAQIVQASDVLGDLYTDPFGHAIHAIDQGDLRVETDDHRLLERGSLVYGAPYAWASRTPKR